MYIKVTVTIISFFGAIAPPVGQGLFIHQVSGSHTTTHYSRQDSSGRVTSPSQKPLPDNTQHSQQRNIHAPGGIRTHSLSRRAAADLRLRPRGHWNRRRWLLTLINYLHYGSYTFGNFHRIRLLHSNNWGSHIDVWMQNQTLCLKPLYLMYRESHL